MGSSSLNHGLKATRAMPLPKMPRTGHRWVAAPAVLGMDWNQLKSTRGDDGDAELCRTMQNCCRLYELLLLHLVTLVLILVPDRHCKGCFVPTSYWMRRQTSLCPLPRNDLWHLWTYGDLCRFCRHLACEGFQHSLFGLTDLDVCSWLFIWVLFSSSHNTGPVVLWDNFVLASSKAWDSAWNLDESRLAYAHGLQEGYEGRDCVKQMICCKKNPQPGDTGWDEWFWLMPAGNPTRWAPCSGNRLNKGNL